MATKETSSELNYEPNYIEIKGGQIHYVDVGEGDPIPFLYGNPTSSYLWRNIIPYVEDLGRVIAPDLIGMGKSDKLDIGCGFFPTYYYLEEFIEKMGLKNITLVVHDWGSGLGFYSASQHQDNTKAIAFMESMVREVDIKGLTRSMRMGMNIMRTPGFGCFFIVVMNMFLNDMLARSINWKISPEEIRAYKDPFPTRKSRKLILKSPREIPLNGKPNDVAEALEIWSNYLATPDIPKLGFYVTRGGVIKDVELKWVKENMSNLKLIYLRGGVHFIQEDYPHEIGEELATWYQEITNSNQEGPLIIQES